MVVRHVDGGAGQTCASILRLLPSWFGIPEANQRLHRHGRYVSARCRSPASAEDDVGITTVKHHSPYAAEIYLMAVKPAYHRRGIGSLMMLRSRRGAPCRRGRASSYRSRPSAQLESRRGLRQDPRVLAGLRVPSARGVPDPVGSVEPGAAADQDRALVEEPAVSGARFDIPGSPAIRSPPMGVCQDG